MRNIITVENVSPEDAKALLDVYAIYVTDTAVSFEYEVPSVEEFRSRILEITSRYPYIKAVDQSGEILGYAYAASFKNRKAYDWSVETTIYIRNDCRGRGIGSLLYDSLEQKLKKMGILNMNACIAYTSQPDEHLVNDSRYFHEAMGFRLVGTFHQSGYKFNKWYDMIWMEKMIGEHVENPMEIKAAR